MKHTIILGSTGLVLGGLSALVGLPQMVEAILWVITCMLWVVYGVRVQHPTPVRSMIVAGTLAGLLCATVKVVFMEQYKTNNTAWAYIDASAQELMIGFVGSGIGAGVVAGAIVGLTVRWRLQKAQA